jgi:hypothetical protein
LFFYRTQPKEEQNIKRRVYDALNVLIAADVLKKRGKKVFSDETSLFLGNSFKKSAVSDQTMLREELVITKLVSCDLILKYFFFFKNKKKKIKHNIKIKLNVSFFT